MSYTPYKKIRISFDMTINCSDPALKSAVTYLLKNYKFRKNYKAPIYLETIISNLVLAFKRGENCELLYHRNNNFYTKVRKNRTINPKGLGGILVEDIKNFEALGFIHSRKGFYDLKGNGKKSTISKMRASEKFIEEVIIPFNLHLITFNTVEIHNPIQIKNTHKKIINTYNNHPEFISLKEKVEAYNSLYKDTEIAYKHPKCGAISPEAKYLYRVFKQDMRHLGRFYGAWWTYTSKEVRSNILINGEETVELDYAGNHIGLLYGMTGKPMPEELRENPYIAPQTSLRKKVKQCIVNSINSKARISSWRSIRNENQRNKIKPNMSYDFFNKAMNYFFSKYSSIEKLFFNKDLSLTLQYLDSVVADTVLEDVMIKQGIPILPVHDAFIVARQHKDKVLKAMEDAYTNSDNPIIKNGFTSIKNKTDGG